MPEPLVFAPNSLGTLWRSTCRADDCAERRSHDGFTRPARVVYALPGLLSHACIRSAVALSSSIS
jgi:hypothetical protein